MKPIANIQRELQTVRKQLYQAQQSLQRMIAKLTASDLENKALKAEIAALKRNSLRRATKETKDAPAK